MAHEGDEVSKHARTGFWLGFFGGDFATNAIFYGVVIVGFVAYCLYSVFWG